MRWRIEYMALIALLLGCGPGQPWGVVEPNVVVDAWQPPEERLTALGHLRTARSYVVQLNKLELTLGRFTAILSDTDAALTFDPGNPPPGYSLCHNGHCHAESGALVDYDVIERELGGGSGQAVAVVLPLNQTVTLRSTPISLKPEPCAGCELVVPGVLSLATLNITHLTLEAHVTDTSILARLPEEGVNVQATVEMDTPLTQALSIEFDNQHRVGARLNATLRLPFSLFDDIDFSAHTQTNADLSDDAIFTRALNAGLVEETELVIEVQRFDP